MMAETNNRQVIARFMQNTFEMKGVDTGRSLKALLSQLDKRGIPADAAPEAVEKGFALDKIAMPMWNAKGEVDVDHGRTKKTPWTLQQFQSVVAVLLHNLSARPGRAQRLGQEELKEIIELLQVEEPFADVEA